MNEKFIAFVKKTGVTGYKLSKKSGVPYTTINELLTGKKDINKKAAETVLRLAEAMNCSITDILNPVFVMDGVSGKCKGVSYVWKRKDDHMVLETTYKKKKQVIETKYKLQNFVHRGDYDELAYLYISPMLREEKLKEKMACQEW
jgi:hypothetical protein